MTAYQQAVEEPSLDLLLFDQAQDIHKVFGVNVVCFKFYFCLN